MRVRLLGPVDVTAAGTARPVPGMRRKAILAVLALHPREVVSTDRLVHIVWGDQAPQTAVNTVQSHISQLRRILGGKTAILARPPGYLLNLDEPTDVEAVERLISQADRATEDAERAEHLRAALDLWRGRPLADLAGPTWLDEQADRLGQLRVRTKLRLIDIRLSSLGEHHELIPDLELMARDHPFDEEIHQRLMLALYRAGRQADALATFRRLRQTLDHDLGISPSQTSRDLETAILRQEPGLGLPGSTATRAIVAATMTVPAQLPPAVHGFVGRHTELATLDGLVPPASPAEQAHPGAVVVAVVSGTAGVGKTALAVQWAHRAAGNFPDGQLYVDLRGFGPSGAVADPAVALRGFLEALGVPAARIPTTMDAQAALYRSVLAGKRVLVVLNNARDAEQVRPLLPSGAGSMVLVTSRDQLTPLVAADGAHLLMLDLLSPPEARDLVTQRLGASRVAAELDPVDEIIRRCARLPLALAVAAARAVTQPRLPLADLAAELRHAAVALDGVSAGADPALNIRSVFSWSYRTLNAEAAQLFRLLGLTRVPDITVPAAASLCGVPRGRAHALLAELTGAQLLTEQIPGRYSCHDLLHAYASELTRTLDPPEDRHAALRRLLDHYLHTTYAAALLLHPHRDPIDLAPAAAAATWTEPADMPAAMTWFTAEHPALLAAVSQAAAAGLDAHAWQLVWGLADYLDRRGHWRAWAELLGVALRCARRLGDVPAEAYVRRCLGRACAQLGVTDDAFGHFQEALRLFEESADATGQAHSHLNLAWMFGQQEAAQTALDHARQAVRLYQVADHRPGQARALNSVAWQLARLHDYRQALAFCQQSLTLFQQLDDQRGEANAWDTAGYVHHHLDLHTQAADCYLRAINLFRQVGDRYYEADTFAHLGDAQSAAGDPDTAHRTWRRALEILDKLGHPDAGKVRERLRGPAAARPAPAASGARPLQAASRG